MKVKTTILILILLTLTSLSILPTLPFVPKEIKSVVPMIPHSFASNGVHQIGLEWCGSQAPGSNCNVGVGNSVTVGDVLYVMAGVVSTTTTCTSYSISDSHNSYTLQYSVTVDITALGNEYCVFLWTAPVTVGVTNVTITTGSCSCETQLFLMDASGYSNTANKNHGVGSSQSQVSSSATNSTSFFTSDLLLAEVTNTISCATTTPGSSYTLFARTLGSSATNVQDCAQYSLSGVSSPTTFPLSWTGNWYYSMLGASFNETTVTETLLCKLQSPGGSSESITFSGGSVSPTSGSCSLAGTTNTLSMVPATLTITGAANLSLSSYIGNSSWTSSQTVTTVSVAGAQSNTIYMYQQLKNTWTMTPQFPNTWDHAYHENVTGTNAGVTNTKRCTITLTGGSGAASCTGWADNDTATSLPASFASASSGTWTGTAPVSFTDLTGGNTHNVNYNLSPGTQNYFRYVILNGGPSPGKIYMSCPISSSPTQTTLTTSSQAVNCDNGGAATVNASSIYGGSGIRYEINVTSYTVGSGGATFVFTYNYQYELNMSVSGPGVTSPVSSGFYNSGNTVTITAFPNAGSAFSSWTGSGSGSFTGTSASATVTMSASIKELATFNSAGSVSVSLTLNLINSGKILNSTNYFSINYFSGGVSTNIHFVGTNPLTFTADGARAINITSPSQSSGSKNRWCLSTGCSLFQTPNSPLSGSWNIAYSYFVQDNESVFFTAPVSCMSCSGQVPSISYVQFGSHVTSTISTSPATIWVDNQTSWSTGIPFFYDLAYYVPSPSGGTFSKAGSLDILYSATPSSSLAANCGSATDPFVMFIHMCWIPAFVLSYGNLIGTENFLTILFCVFAVAVWLKSGNPLLSVMILLLGFATFSGVSAGIGSTPFTFISSIGWQIALVFFILVATGVTVRLFTGRNS